MAGPSFPVRIKHDAKDGLFYATCTSLQGCHTFGTSRAEALTKIKEAMVGHLAVALHEGPAKLEHGIEVVDLVA